MQILFIREFLSRSTNSTNSFGTAPPVTINLVHPGLCYSPGTAKVIFPIRILLSIVGRSTEAGSRTFVNAACAGPETHGEFLNSDINVGVEPWILTEVGARAQRKVFEQTMKVLEKRAPGVATGVGV
jgi:retinol dehydrogenase 12